MVNRYFLAGIENVIAKGAGSIFNSSMGARFVSGTFLGLGIAAGSAFGAFNSFGDLSVESSRSLTLGKSASAEEVSDGGKGSVSKALVPFEPFPVSVIEVDVVVTDFRYGCMHGGVLRKYFGRSA